MTEYMVFYMLKLSAKSSKDLERKAERVEADLSKHLKKKVWCHGYGEITNKEALKVYEDDKN